MRSRRELLTLRATDVVDVYRSGGITKVIDIVIAIAAVMSHTHSSTPETTIQLAFI